MFLLQMALTEETLKGYYPPKITIIVIGVVIAMAFLLVSVFIAKRINYKADRTDFKKRKLWFWIMGIFALITAFVTFFFIIKPSPEYASYLADANTKFINNYIMMSSIATAGAFVLYIVLGFVLSKIFKQKKIGSWF